MLEGGIRVSHVLKLLEIWRPNERIEVPRIDMVTDNLVVFHDKGFCKYYLGLGETTETCEWTYMSLETLNLINEVAPKRINRSTFSDFEKE